METPVVSTPAPTTETPPAAPATSAPSPSPVASQRPASFQEAFEQVAAQQEKPATAQPEPATTAQAVTTDPTGADHPSADKKGPIPFEVHSKALDNARVKEREAIAAEFERDFGWTKQYTRQQVESFAPIAKQITDDPIGHILDLAESLQSHPVHGPRLRSEAARILASRGVSPAEAEPQPDVQIVGADGQAVGLTYSAKQQAAREAWLKSQWLAEVRQEVAPLKAESDKAKAAAAQAETERAIVSKTDAHLAELLDLLDLPPDAVTKGDPLLAAVSKAMAEHPDWSATKAAVHVRRTQIAPTLEAKAKQKALDDMKTKALGNTVSGTGAATPITKPRTREELRQYMEAHAG